MCRSPLQPRVRVGDTLYVAGLATCQSHSALTASGSPMCSASRAAGKLYYVQAPHRPSPRQHHSEALAPVVARTSDMSSTSARLHCPHGNADGSKCTELFGGPEDASPLGTKPDMDRRREAERIVNTPKGSLNSESRSLPVAHGDSSHPLRGAPRTERILSYRAPKIQFEETPILR